VIKTIAITTAAHRRSNAPWLRHTDAAIDSTTTAAAA
jgi:hypothetical protein